MQKATWIMLLSAIIFAGCSSLEVSLKPNAGFSSASSITVDCDQYDDANLQPRIEQALLRIGFDVISPSVAQTRLQYLSNSSNQLSNPSSQRIPQSSSYQSSSGFVREYKSVYLLKFTYTYDFSLLGDAITDFSASIVDLRTGEVVGTINFSGNGGSSLPDALAKNISERLSKELKQ